MEPQNGPLEDFSPYVTGPHGFHISFGGGYVAVSTSGYLLEALCVSLLVDIMGLIWATPVCGPPRIKGLAWDNSGLLGPFKSLFGFILWEAHVGGHGGCMSMAEPLNPKS